MTVLTSDELGAHPMLKPGFRRSMQQIQRRGGPFECRSCGGPSYQLHRCSKCGKNLVDEGSSGSGRLGVDR